MVSEYCGYVCDYRIDQEYTLCFQSFKDGFRCVEGGFKDVVYN